MIAHAELGASSAHRWMNCGASLRLQRLAPEGAGDSYYAREGTAAHALAERCLTRGADASLFIGTEIEGFEVDEQMAEAVQVFIDHVRTRQADGATQWIERRFNLMELNPPAPMFGTADACTFVPDLRALYVDDLKYGSGHWVDVEGNPQLMYYGLGAFLSLDPSERELVDNVIITIVQPRLPNPIRTLSLPVSELYDFAVELMHAAQRAVEDDAPAVPGDWCRFCKGAPYCDAKGKQLVQIAKSEFAEHTTVSLPDPATLSDEERRKIMRVMDQIEDWFDSLRTWERQELEAGRPIPGRKLVAGRQGNRKWSDEAVALTALRSAGWDDSILVETKLKSPAQLEKKIKPLPDTLIERAPAKLQVVDDDDPRPAVTAPGVTKLLETL